MKSLDYGVYLFGSHARGDNSFNSDLDLISILRSDECVVDKIFDSTHFSESSNIDMSYYSLDKIKELYSSGSLFAWHLHLEAKFKNGYNFLENLNSPNSYSLFKEDVATLKSLLKSVEDSIFKSKKIESPIFEAGMLYLVLRNLSHSLSWFELEKPSFHRLTPFSLTNPSVLKVTRSDYDLLIQARTASTRGSICPEISNEWLREMFFYTQEWFQFKVGNRI